jgi:hypothetical protein
MEISTTNYLKIRPEEILRKNPQFEETDSAVARIDFRNRTAETENCEFSSLGTVFISFCGEIYMCFQSHGLSRIEVEIPSGFQKDEGKKYILNLDHCSALVNELPAVITIKVNGEKVISGYHVPIGHVVQEQLDITPFLQNGYNIVRVYLDFMSPHYYWIQKLSIIEK